MKIFRMLFLLIALQATAKAHQPERDISDIISQAKPNWLALEFGDYHTKLMTELISELNTYTDKIVGVELDQPNGRLTIYYTNLFTADDIIQIVSKYFSDFTKVGGTGIE